MGETSFNHKGHEGTQSRAKAFLNSCRQAAVRQKRWHEGSAKPICVLLIGFAFVILRALRG
jgi:hypothetical protein